MGSSVNTLTSLPTEQSRNEGSISSRHTKFLLSALSRTVLEPTKPRVQMLSEALYLVIKLHDVTTFRCVDMNTWSYISVPHMLLSVSCKRGTLPVQK
jgi:hypothetical protein